MRYQCNPSTTVRAKVNSNGLVQACAVNRCADKVSVTVTAAVSERDTRWLGVSRTLAAQRGIFFEQGLGESGGGGLGKEGYGGYRVADSALQRKG